MKGKKKKKPSAGFLNGAAEPPPRHCRDKGGETVEGSSAVALLVRGFFSKKKYIYIYIYVLTYSVRPGTENWTIC